MSQTEFPSGALPSRESDSSLFAVIPDASKLFVQRARRLRSLAPGHSLEPYLAFAAEVCEAQDRAARTLPAPRLPEPQVLQQAREHAMPPLAPANIEPGGEAAGTTLLFLEVLAGCPVHAEAAAAAAGLKAALDNAPGEIVSHALQALPADNLSERVLLLAGLQIYFSKLAAQLKPAGLSPIADSTCPACGSPPMTSCVVGWPGAHGARFCSCSLCGTMWNAVRVKCVLCSSTEAVSYLAVEGRPETIKAEACGKCGGYLKTLYQVKDHLLDACADDIASLDLDMLLTEQGWRRGGSNPFLLGY